MWIEFELTKRDVLDGEKENVCLCPVALCIKQKLKVSRCRVEHDNVNINRKVVKFPKHVIKFIKEFDSGQIDVRNFKDIKFKLNIQKEVLENV